MAKAFVRRGSRVAIGWLLVCGWFMAFRATVDEGPTPQAASAQPSAVSPVPSARELRNLEAFARLYGWVRWFHPSDEASQVDWDRMAVLGAERVRAAADDAALRASLEALFLPVAPTLRLYVRGETPAAVPPPPPPASRWQAIAWQHLGMGQGEEPYVSARTHRPRPFTRAETAPPFGTITQALPAAELRGKRVRMRAAVRADVEGAGNEAHLWLRVDRPQGAKGFFDNMGDRPIQSHEWATYEIVGVVDGDAEQVVFGCFLLGHGKAWLDRVELAVEEAGAWQPLPVVNGGFEVGLNVAGWQAESPGYHYDVVSLGAEAPGEQAPEGIHVVSITDTNVSKSGLLFAAVPAPGEATDSELVPGLAARVPLVVLGDEKTTWPPAGETLAALQRDLAALGASSWTGEDWRVRVGAMVIAWNVFEHFYPYFDLVKADWPAELTSGLGRALTDRNARQFQDSLRRLVAAASDGHGGVYNRALAQDRKGLPCLLDLVDEKVVVSVPDAAGVLRHGDVVRSIDGVDALEELARAAALRSGSPQWRRYMAVRWLGTGSPGREAKLSVERTGTLLDVSVPRGGEMPQTDHALPPIATLAGGVLYVDLTRAEHAAIAARLAELAAAPGVVFDLRGYPQNGAEEILQHLTASPIQSANWQVPQLLYPDHRRQVGWDTSGRWELPPLQPRIGGKVAFLTGPGAISYGESIMGTVEAYHLGAIVGSTTAGTNGNVNPFTLPGGYNVVFTGMRVLKHDGSQHHLVGIGPTVPVVRTLAAFREGRDEELEAALRVVSGAAGGQR